MNDTYRTSLEQKKQKERENKETDMEEELKRLKYIQKDLKEQERLNNVKKTTFIHEAQEVAEHKRQIKELEQQKKQVEKQEYQKYANQNFQQEVDRENNYKKFFKDYDNQMSERMSNHLKYVTQSQIQKQSKMDEIEGKCSPLTR